jgi:hypothetical protein
MTYMQQMAKNRAEYDAVPKSIFTLNQVHTNPRDGSTFVTAFEDYATLTEAKKAAKKELKGARWVITETKVVARSMAE